MENSMGCNKALWTLVSGASLQTEAGVLGNQCSSSSIWVVGSGPVLDLIRIWIAHKMEINGAKSFFFMKSEN